MVPTYMIFFLRSTLTEIYLRRACSGQYIEDRNAAAGANLLARALRPEGGIVMWRAFVYGGRIDGRWQERAKQAYLTFKPLDGLFDDNVIVQIKNGARLLALPRSLPPFSLVLSPRPCLPPAAAAGPMDFQVREPLSPLLAGGLQHTHVMMEVQAAHEYTGQVIAAHAFLCAVRTSHLV
eukprot:COSAG01_NODE_2116_length_8385_cov_15.810886_3_plen_179_part_00